MAAITVSDLAQELGTDARTTRKFLRSITPREEQPGKGARWSIEKKHLRSLKAKFRTFESQQRAAREVPVTDEEFDSLDPVEVDPTDEELAELEG